MMLSQTLRQLTRCTTSSLLRFSTRIYHKRRCQRFILLNYVSGHRRMFSTPAPFVNESSITMEIYNEKADKTMDELLERLEELVDATEGVGQEVEYHSGVLTLNLGSHGTYVINKQPPNKQIWLSSPISGPKRYDFVEESNSWVYSRDGGALHELLSKELSAIFGQDIDIVV